MLVWFPDQKRKMQTNQSEFVNRLIWLQQCHVPVVRAISGATGHRHWLKWQLTKLLLREDVGGFGHLYKGHLLGYVLFRMSESEFTIIDFGVRPACQRRKVATHLFNDLKRRVRRGRRDCITAKVPDYCLTAHLFLKSCGFVAEQIIRGYGNKPDHYVFRHRYQPPTASAGGTI